MNIYNTTPFYSCPIPAAMLSTYISQCHIVLQVAAALINLSFFKYAWSHSTSFSITVNYSTLVAWWQQTPVTEGVVHLGTAGEWLELPVCARKHCRLSPPDFPAECRKRRLNLGTFVLLFFFCVVCFFCVVVSSLYYLFLICLLSCIFQGEPTWMALYSLMCWCAVKNLLTQLSRLIDWAWFNVPAYTA